MARIGRQRRKQSAGSKRDSGRSMVADDSNSYLLNKHPVGGGK